MKKIFLSSLGCFLFTLAFAQNNPPVAIDDTVEVMSQVSIEIEVLANDYDPDGDGISIDHWYGPIYGSEDTLAGIFRYKSENYTGEDHITYFITDNGTPPLVSLSGKVYINILPNPDVPVASNDTFELLELVPIELDLLANDTDLNGNELIINALKSINDCEVTIREDSLKVIVIPEFTTDMVAQFKYTAKEKNTPEAYWSNWTIVYIKILSNPDIPVLVPDTAYSTGGIAVTIPVLENDYDLQGDSFGILSFTQPANGIVVQVGDSLLFNPDVSFQGTSIFMYSVSQLSTPYIYTRNTHVRVEVIKNPDCPVGVPDYSSGMTYSPITIDVLANDYDINGDPLEIRDIESEGTTNISGNKIIYISDPLAPTQDTLYYRARQSNDSTYYSEWTPVYVDLAINPDLPVAVEDHFTARSVFQIIISPLMNDIENTADSLKILYVKPSGKSTVFQISDSLFSYQAFTNTAGRDSLEYAICDKYNPYLRAKGKIYVDITDPHYYDSLVINNINAGVNADGMLFANVGQLPGQGMSGNFNPHFKYPYGSGTNTIFNSVLWIGGVTGQDSLYFAGGRYRAGGSDIQPGPVSNDYDSNFAYRYWKLWKLNKTDIEYHRNNWSQQGYQPIKDIASWPGNGLEASGQAAQLAPYSDFNQDGKYDPMDGDYPLIRGDQSIYFMMNDDKSHGESYGNKLKVEIHGMVYGFATPDDSVLFNTVFVHYDLINRSDKYYNDAYVGIFTDFDLGNFWDDNVGSEVSRGSYYCFNGDLIDEDLEDPYYSAEGYGEFPPAQSVTVLAGPFMDDDGIDNPSGGCDFSVNGLNFGNGINDDERFGLTGFMYRSYTGPQHTYYARELYDMMKGIWSDNSRIQFGGNGHDSDPGAVGPDCNFIFPGDSDPMNWGTGCVPPNPPYNQEGFYWTDSNTNIPGDRSGLGAMGPFTFEPGQVQEIELAYCVANGWEGPISSVVKLMENIDSLRSRVQNGQIIVPNDYLGLKKNKTTYSQLRIFPNPADNIINVQLQESIPEGSEFIIYDVLGEVAQRGKISSIPGCTLNICNLKPGFYILLVKSHDLVYSGKFIRR